MTLIAVFFGAGLGGVLRHGAGLALHRAWPGFPAGTLFVNVAGSLLMGVLMAAALRRGVGPHAIAFLGPGLLGGFTTFSAFTMDTALLVQRGSLCAASLYIAASLLLSLAAFAAGAFLARDLFFP